MDDAKSHTPRSAGAAEGPKVLAVSTRNPLVRTIAVARPPREDASFLVASIKALGVTVGHFFRNVASRAETETVEYPEETVPYPERFRGLHRLMTRDDGRVRCVACMCCPTACPANCITIIPAETDDAGVEKFPAVFEIDELRCVVCGLCVEACPCDAIRMDTGVHAKPVEFRGEAIETKATLLARGTISIATQGGAGADWRDGGSARPK
jgi:NADH-quinone oxidoreductase subunit I